MLFADANINYVYYNSLIKEPQSACKQPKLGTGVQLARKVYYNNIIYNKTISAIRFIAV